MPFQLFKIALDFVSRPSMRSEVTAGVRAVFDAADRSEAQRQLEMVEKKYRAKASKLPKWPE